MKRCINCGMKFEEKSDFCPFCQETIASVALNREIPPNKSEKYISFFYIFLLILICAAVFFFFQKSESYYDLGVHSDYGEASKSKTQDHHFIIGMDTMHIVFKTNEDFNDKPKILIQHHEGEDSDLVYEAEFKTLLDDAVMEDSIVLDAKTFIPGTYTLSIKLNGETVQKKTVNLEKPF